MNPPEKETGFEDLRKTIVDLHKLLESHELPHAFGGAIALAFYTEPRATADIDINVFRPKAQGPEVLHILNSQMSAEEAKIHEEHIEKFYGASVPYKGAEVDLFFSFTELHDQAAERIRNVEYRDVSIPIISPEDLIIFKVMYSSNPDRLDRDWPDIAGMLINQSGNLDSEYIQTWLHTLLPDDDPRFNRLRNLGLPERGATNT
ncbi:MAG TPA: hypothetical protein VLF39_02105 [Candidatus Saccharimonadales bacterium]|nr:hypothetical protein [Candidatus Saccharimonadales bacterium]